MIVIAKILSTYLNFSQDLISALKETSMCARDILACRRCTWGRGLVVTW